jgi:signal transduction histidine kinase
MKIFNAFKAFVFLFLFSNCYLSAQSKLDSLKIALKNSNGEERVNTLNNLSIVSRYSSLIDALDYANQAIQIAEQIDYKIGLGDGYKSRGIVYYMQHKYDEAIKDYDFANEIFLKLNNPEKISAILNNIAIIYVIQGNYEQALNDYLESAEINIELENWTSVANIYNNIGMVYSKWGNSEKTIEYYNKSLELSLREDNKIGIAAAYNNLGLVQNSLGNYASAIEYYQMGIKVNEELGDISGMSRCMRNMATVYTNLNNDDKAIELIRSALEFEKQLNNEQGVLKTYDKIGQLQKKIGDYEGAIDSYMKSIEVAKQFGNKEQLVNSYRQLGGIYYSQENYKIALDYYNQALEISIEIENFKSQAFLLKSIGSCYRRTNKNNEAIDFFLRSKDLANKYEIIILIEDIYRLLSETYSIIGDYKNAFHYQSEYIKIHEKIFNEENQKRIAEIESKYELEKKENEIFQLKAEQQESKRKNQLIIILLAFLILLVVSGFIYNQNLIRKKSLQLLDKKNVELEKTNKELIIAKERAENADKLKTAFLANISHEIRTPMNAIIGFSEFLTEPDVDNNQRQELIELIQLNGDLLLSLIDDILDVALIESGQLRIKSEKVKVIDILNQTYQLLKNDKKIKENGIEFIIDVIPSDEKIEITSDSFRLKQILLNILSNAIKFTNSGKILFGFKTIKINGVKQIEFNVTDTGIGIDKKYHNQIFDMFFKAPTDKSVLYRGAGVGLFITKSLVNQMGGRIWVHSVLEKGSTFYFTHPVLKNSS